MQRLYSPKSRLEGHFTRGLHPGAGALVRRPAEAVRFPRDAVARTDAWDNEGGGLGFVAPRDGALVPSAEKRTHQDTVAGCQERALADLSKAAAMGAPHERLRMERSAAGWVARANLLQKLDDGFSSLEEPSAEEMELEEPGS